MQFKPFKGILTPAVRLATVLLLGAGIATAQQVINLTAAPTTATLPDGSAVPMWGYSCGIVATSTTAATCAPSNTAVQTTAATTSAAAVMTGWSPVVITVPYVSTGTSLTINLTNHLSFTPAGATTANTIPTSIMIVGQVGGGLGVVAQRTTTASPAHPAQDSVTWSTVTTLTPATGGFTPPTQPNRVQSFGTEVASGATTALTWPALRPGTYLLESGTHPGIQATMGLIGMLVVTTPPVGTTAGVAYPFVAAVANVSAAVPVVNYNAEVPLLLSEIDPVQNKAVNAAVNTAGFSETTVWSGLPGGCGNPLTATGTANTTYNTCYPPVVNYTPTYYLINGQAFDKTHPSNSLFKVVQGTVVPTGAVTGTVLARFVNAGSHMHVPTIVGSQTTGYNGSGASATVTGFTLIAEDGNRVPSFPQVRSEIFMAAGKTYDVMVNVPAIPTGATVPPSLPVYDRELSLSGGKINRDAGMLAYISVNGGTLPTGDPGLAPAFARADAYPSVVPGQTLVVSDPGKGVIANDTNVFGVNLFAPPTKGTVTLNADGTFTYEANAGTAGAAGSTWDSFTYCANGTVGVVPPATTPSCSSGITATVTLQVATIEASSGITCSAQSFGSTMSAYLAVKTPGVLAGCKDAAGYPLKLVTSTIAPASGMTVVADANGGFTASLSTPCGVATGCPYNFNYQVQNSQGTTITTSSTNTATVNFPAGSGLVVNVLDGYDKTTQITDYRWIIEEDRTFYINPNCTANPPPAGCPNAATGVVPTLGVNFHTSNMPFVAQGCTGPLSCEAGQTVLGQPAVCDVSNGVCRPDTAGTGSTAVMPGQVHLDPTKRYYISVLPGDAANPFYGASANGHGMAGAPISIDPNTGLQATAVTVLTQPTPFPTAKLSVFVFEDDFPLNGEQDGGGQVADTALGAQEPGLGGFQIHLWDAMGGNGDFTGQMTYDMFNQPLTNSLDGTKDPATSLNACPITQAGVKNPGTNATNGPAGSTLANTAGITGMIVTCPKYESDGVTESPLAGQAVVSNLMPGRWGVIATPGADRIAKGEEWLQTNTLDGQKAHDSFTRIGEPSYFQEFGPASFHVSVGFANPAIINARHAAICAGTDPNFLGIKNCNNTLVGRVTGERLSRTPDERLYGSGSHDAFAWTQCYVSFGDPDGEDFAFTKCDANGNFKLTGLPDGDWRITTFDQWNDALVDGLSTPVRLSAGTTPTTTNFGDIAATQWQTNLYTKTFIDDNKDGIAQTAETGIPFANVAVRLRDGSLENLLVTDFTGVANFNETFPLFSWYTVETDVTRYKNTGTHVVYDAGGPADGSLTTCGGTTPGAGYPPCGNSVIGKYLANTIEQISVPTNLRVPGAIYCAGADCTGKSMDPLNGSTASDPPSVCTTSATGATTCSTTLSTGRIDPPWVGVEGWQGFPGQNSFIEFGKAPYYPGENGGIKGHVIYASTRPFDDPMMLVQTQWEPLVPHVTINLYQEGFAADGVTPTLNLVDTTQTSSFDDYAQGFRADGVTPNMNCPGQGAATGANPDLFFFSLYNQPNYLNWYNSQHGGPAFTPLPNNSQFKCYDGMHDWNQVQPAPYDGAYQFPSVTSTNATTGRPTGTNCTICKPDPVPATGTDADPLRAGLPILPPGKYVVEIVVPPGFELVKEEDKNILIGDNYIAPVTQQFGGLGDIFILPDQASVASSQQYPGPGFNAYNTSNSTQSLGTTPSNNIVPGFVPEPTWPCVGTVRTVPDYISLYPQSKQMSPFAGASRPLCDRKEVTLNDQVGAIAKFYIYTSTHIASKFTGGITDDYTSEFDPFSPQFGEKFAPPDLPVSVKDWAGNEISRVYADHWGAYNGMTYSTWEVNPPNPTGYSPNMMVFCMNDPGPITDTVVGSPTNGGLITDPLFTQGYSQFCYELPFMPGTTQYLDTPVVPTSAFAGAGYNNVDCAYPTLTPAVSEVDGDSVGPWVSLPGNTLTINALGDQQVPNNAYSGPSATTAPFNQKTILRHYGFGTRCTTPTAGSATCNTASSVTIGGVAATVLTWSDTQITVTVPSTVPNCSMQQQAQYGGTTAKCGQLAVTAGNGKQSVDAVTVTIGGKAPTHISAQSTIQSAIDAASPGDLLIVDPTCSFVGVTIPCVIPGETTTTAAHLELLLMWKPLRLQGVGAATSIINANTHPAGKLDPWRRQVTCLFGLGIGGTPVASAAAYDPSGQFTCGSNMFFQVDRVPLEATVGWDATLNGNLAELLQEPTLMGALEGAGITVLGKGVAFPAGSNPFASDIFPVGTVLLQNVTGVSSSHCTDNPNPYPSNFMCNPSSIDGLGITDSSQGGGGIFLHGWNHNLQIANNRIYNNAGTLSGGINLGQGEFPTPYLSGAANAATNAAPGSCMPTLFAAQPGAVLPYCQEMNVNMHNNYVALNSSTGDELFSATPAGAGGVSICTGSDYYKFQYNWVCGNLSSGDGGGIGHMGLSYNGDIEHNTIVFNQSLNPTIPANGGGIIIMGAPDADPVCPGTADTDCIVAPNAVTPSDGIGPNLVINANLIMGNAAEAGTGGGIAFQNVNGSDVVAFPTNSAMWWAPSVTNNIIVDNVAGWDGGGISLLDTLNINIVNNTIASNSTTATAGVLFNTIGGPLASQGGPTCTSNCGVTSHPQPAGLVAVQNSAVLQANLPATITCAGGHFAPGTSATNGSCRTVSYPALSNNVFWQNSSFYIGVGALSPQFQQNVVTLYNLGGTAIGNQATTGACAGTTGYWDIGVRGDTGPGNHASTVSLNPQYSVLTNASENGLGGHNFLATNPAFVSQYCDGSRQPPEYLASGWAVPPGISDATVPNPVFNLTPVATVDEGNNWINLRWGPLTMVNPKTNAILGNYAPAASSAIVDSIPSTASTFALAPLTDFFGNPRRDAGENVISPGAIEIQDGATAVASVAPTSVNFGSVAVPGVSGQQTLTLTNSGNAPLTGITLALAPVGGPFTRTGGTCGTTLAAPVPPATASTCTFILVFSPLATGTVTGTATITANVLVVGSPVALTGTGVAPTFNVIWTPPSWSPSANRATTPTATQVFVLTNNSNIGLTGIAQGALAGANALDYTILRAASTCGPAGGGQLTGQTTLAIGASCIVTVQFTPRATTPAGPAPATLSVNYGPGVHTATATLSGTVNKSLAPATLAFPNTARGATSAAQTLTLSNATGTPLTVAATIGGTNPTYFSRPTGAAGGTCGTTLATGASCTINVVFSPPAAPTGTIGPKAATITAGGLATTLSGTAQ